MFAEFLDGVNGGGAGGGVEPPAGDPAGDPTGGEASHTPAEPVAWEDVSGEYMPAAPEGVDADAWGAEIGELAKLAHEKGIASDVFGELVSAKFTADAAVAAREAEEQEVALASAVGALRGEWGTEFDLKLTAANDGIRKVASAAGVDVEAIMQDPLFRRNVDLVKMFAVIGMQSGGGSGVPASAAAVPVGTGGAAEADRIIKDASHPLHEAFMNSAHPNHKYANERVNAAMGIA